MATKTSPAAAPSAAPGTTAPAAKKEKIVKVAYSIPEGGLKAIPTDWNPKVHKPLLRKDYHDEFMWFVARAETLEKGAKRCRALAEESKKLGSVKDRAKARRLLGMQKRMSELKAQLSEEGVNVDELLANLEA